MVVGTRSGATGRRLLGETGRGHKSADAFMCDLVRLIAWPNPMHVLTWALPQSLQVREQIQLVGRSAGLQERDIERAERLAKDWRRT